MANVSYPSVDFLPLIWLPSQFTPFLCDKLRRCLQDIVLSLLIVRTFFKEMYQCSSHNMTMFYLIGAIPFVINVEVC